MNKVENDTIKLLGNKLFYTVIGSAVGITITVCATYFGLKSEMLVDRTNMEKRQIEVDGKFEKLESLNTNLDKRITAVEGINASLFGTVMIKK